MKDKLPSGWKKAGRSTRLLALFTALLFLSRAWIDMRFRVWEGPGLEQEARFICYFRAVVILLSLLEFFFPWRPDLEMPKGCLLEGSFLLLISVCCGVGGIFVPWDELVWVAVWMLLTVVTLSGAVYYFWKNTRLKNPQQR